MRLRSKLLGTLLLLASLPISFVNAHNFQDVRHQDWFANYIDQLEEGGIINTDTANFYPNRSITRAELAKMVVKSAQYKGKLPVAMVTNQTVFCDVGGDSWAHEFVSILASKGVNGVSDSSCNLGKKFLPNQPVTRAEALKIMFLVYNIEISGSSTFSDVSQSSWFNSYVATAVRLSLVNGYPDRTFRPNGLLTRAEMSKVVTNLMNQTDSPATTTPTPTPLPTITSDDDSFTLPTINTPHGSNQVNVRTEAELREAIGNAEPGDEIILTAGTYRLSRQLWIDKQGTESNPIIIRSAGEKYSAKLTGSPEEGINIGDGAAYLVIDGLEVFGMGDNNIHVQNAHHITLQNIKSYDAGRDGDVIKVNQAHHVIVQNSELSRSGARPGCPGENCWQELIDFVDTDDSEIRDNVMTDFGNLAGYVKGGSTNVLITGNTITGQRSGAGDPSWGIGGWTDSELLRGRQYEAINVRFENNTITNSSYGALGIYDANNVQIRSNTFNNNRGILIEFKAGNAPSERSDNITITANRFNNNQPNPNTLCVISSHDASGIAISNNSGNTTAAVSATDCISN
jgi:nitrous oxidase accessory protein NosD